MNTRNHLQDFMKVVCAIATLLLGIVTCLLIAREIAISEIEKTFNNQIYLIDDGDPTVMSSESSWNMGESSLESVGLETGTSYFQTVGCTVGQTTSGSGEYTVEVDAKDCPLMVTMQAIGTDREVSIGCQECIAIKLGTWVETPGLTYWRGRVFILPWGENPQILNISK